MQRSFLGCANQIYHTPIPMPYPSREVRIARRSIFDRCDQGLSADADLAFESHDEALAYWWALANCKCPEIAYVFDTDFHSNKDLGGKPFPKALERRIRHFIAEINGSDDDVVGVNVTGMIWKI